MFRLRMAQGGQAAVSKCSWCFVIKLNSASGPSAWDRIDGASTKHQMGSSVFRILPLCIAMLALTCCSTASGQNEILQPPINSLNRLMIGESQLVGPAPPHRNGSADQRYWVVSARHCDYSLHADAPCCALQYFEGCSGRITRQVSLEQFCASLNPGVPICLQIHGSFAEFDGGYANSTSRWLKNAAHGQPFEMVFLTWPSDRMVVIPMVDIGILGRRASKTGFFAADLINHLPPESPVCVVGHSHGARVASSALHLLGGGTVNGRRYGQPVVPRQLRTVLLAAAIDHHWLNPGERFGNALCATESLINVRNHRDCALKIYCLRKPFGRKALAISGFTQSDRNAMGWRNGRLKEVDVSRQLGLGHIMMRFAAQPQLANLVLPSVLEGNRQVAVQPTETVR